MDGSTGSTVGLECYPSRHGIYFKLMNWCYIPDQCNAVSSTKEWMEKITCSSFFPVIHLRNVSFPSP